MTKFDVVKATAEFQLKGFEYSEYMTADQDDAEKYLARFDSKEEAVKYLQDNHLMSEIWEYPSNGLVRVEEYYIAENEYDEVDGEMEFVQGSLLTNIMPVVKK